MPFIPRAWLRGPAFLLALGLLSSCARGGSPPTEVPAVAAVTPPATGSSPAPIPAADDRDEGAIDLSITFDPRVTGNAGWVKLPNVLGLEWLGDAGASILDATAARLPGAKNDPFRVIWLNTMLRRASLADTSLILDEESLCSDTLQAAVEKARPDRMLVSIEGGITSKVVGCLRALATPRLYLTGCLYRSHGTDSCDGDAELDALVSDEAVFSRVRGLAVSLGKRESMVKLAKLARLEYLALTPGLDAAGDALFEDLPFDALPRARYLEASGENGHAFTRSAAALRFIGHLHTLRWNGELAMALPAPCRLERVSFDRLNERDVEALAGCGLLRELSSDDAQFDSAKAVARFTELGRLHLRHWKATDLASLAELGKLENLSLPAGKACDFSFVASMIHLRSVDFSQTCLSSLSPFAKLTLLEELDIAFTPVSDLSPIRALRRLEDLDLYETKVADIALVAGLTSLKNLSIASTAVSDLHPLEKHPSLEKVMLYDSKVTDASALLTLPKLRRANIKGLKLPRDQVEKLRLRLLGELYE